MCSALRLLKGLGCVDRFETQSFDFWNHLSHTSVFRADLEIQYDENKEKIIYYEAQFNKENLCGNKRILDFFIGWAEAGAPPRGSQIAPAYYVLRSSPGSIVEGHADQVINVGVCLNFPNETITFYQTDSDGKKQIRETKRLIVHSNLCLYPVCSLGSFRGVRWCLGEYSEGKDFREDDPWEIQNSMSVLQGLNFDLDSFVHIDFQWWLKGQWCPLPYVFRKGVLISLANLYGRVLDDASNSSKSKAFPALKWMFLLFKFLEMLIWSYEWMATCRWIHWWNSKNMVNASNISAAFFACLLLFFRCFIYVVTNHRMTWSRKVSFYAGISFISSLILTMMFFLGFPKFRELNYLNALLWPAVIIRICLTVWVVCLLVIGRRYAEDYSNLERLSKEELGGDRGGMDPAALTELGDRGGMDPAALAELVRILNLPEEQRAQEARTSGLKPETFTLMNKIVRSETLEELQEVLPLEQLQLIFKAAGMPGSEFPQRPPGSSQTLDDRLFEEKRASATSQIHADNSDFEGAVDIV